MSVVKPCRTPPMERRRIFISYRRSDSAGHAGRLEADLTRLLRTPVFMDVSDIAPGEDFAQILDRELRSCAAVLAVIGPRWRDGFAAPRDGPDYVRIELRQAFSSSEVTVIPVLVQGATLPSSVELPADVAALASRQAVSLRDDRWDDDVRHLARSLRSSLGLGRWPPWLIPAAVAALGILAGAAWLLQPETPSAFNWERATEVAFAAVRRAATSCGTLDKRSTGECPLVLKFVPSGRVDAAYYNAGYCPAVKGSPFGDCMLRKLESARIAPFNDKLFVEMPFDIAVDPNGEVSILPPQ
jgi:TIR domain-containing protein